MIKIRKGVFETNSSAVHCLSVMAGGLEKSRLKIHEDGKIHVSLMNLSDNEPYVSGQKNKLSYLITQAFYNHGYDIDDLDSCWEFGCIQEAISEYTGAKGIEVINSNCYINHQAAGQFPIDIYCKDAVIGFVFGKDIYLKQYHD